MSSVLTKLNFRLALYAAFLNVRRGWFQEVPATPLEGTEGVPKHLKVYFWTPVTTPGANVIVHDMLPALTALAKEVAPGWEIRAGAALPANPVDWLICFKAIPDATKIQGRPCKVLLICDQADVYWEHMGEFDAIVATSSRMFAALLAARHQRVTFISETEPLEYLEYGRKNLDTPPAERGNVMLWHGGHYSLEALNVLRPGLEDWAARTDVQLHIVSGSDGPRMEGWGALTVNYFPWSKEQLKRSAAVARLGLIPARFSLKSSWLKPASRVRCLYALGVPAIGDDRVPDVAEFLTSFDGPLAGRDHPWHDIVQKVWNDHAALNRLAVRGHATVKERFSTAQTAWQWLRYLAKPIQGSILYHEPR